METLVIDRKLWLRGEGSTDSKLFRPADGKMCCLGIYLKGKGFTDEELADKDAPSSVCDIGDATMERMPLWLRGKVFGGGTGHRTSNVCNRLMAMNDDTDIGTDDELREQHLKAMFMEVDVRVEFVP